MRSCSKNSRVVLLLSDGPTLVSHPYSSEQQMPLKPPLLSRSHWPQQVKRRCPESLWEGPPGEGGDGQM